MSAETALITGASSGIGRELAELFAADDSDLVLVARNEDRLQAAADELVEAHGIRVRVLPADLSVPGAAERLVRTVGDDGVRVDIVVNNAGFGARGPVAELAFERQRDMIRLNAEALTTLTRLLLPAMIERGRGGILNVASTAAFQPGPYMSVYYATKSYVLSFTEALAEEVSGTGVHICCLAPGPTRTGFLEEARMRGARLVRLGMMDADTVARAGYRGLRRGRTLVVPGILNRMGTLLARLAPRVLVRKLTGYLNY